MIKDSSSDIFLGIVSKALKMPILKVYLYGWMAQSGVAHPIRAGVGGGTIYHRIVNKLLTRW